MNSREWGWSAHRNNSTLDSGAKESLPATGHGKAGTDCGVQGVLGADRGGEGVAEWLLGNAGQDWSWSGDTGCAAAGAWTWGEWKPTAEAQSREKGRERAQWSDSKSNSKVAVGLLKVRAAPERELFHAAANSTALCPSHFPVALHSRPANFVEFESHCVVCEWSNDPLQRFGDSRCRRLANPCCVKRNLTKAFELSAMSTCTATDSSFCVFSSNLVAISINARCC